MTVNWWLFASFFVGLSIGAEIGVRLGQSFMYKRIKKEKGPTDAT